MREEKPMTMLMNIVPVHHGEEAFLAAVASAARDLRVSGASFARVVDMIAQGIIVFCQENGMDPMTATDFKDRVCLAVYDSLSREAESLN